LRCFFGVPTALHCRLFISLILARTDYMSALDVREFGDKLSLFNSQSVEVQITIEDRLYLSEASAMS
jgi:hypothetical protein